jgi:hypothetical protein
VRRRESCPPDLIWMFPFKTNDLSSINIFEVITQSPVEGGSIVPVGVGEGVLFGLHETKKKKIPIIITQYFIIFFLFPMEGKYFFDGQ